MNVVKPRKGIILAGGTGSRLYPLTISVSKQLLPVYDKPMIYYPISTLMLAGIKDFLIISTPNDMPNFKKLLKDGSQWGIHFSYIVQDKPTGIASAFVLGADFIGNDNCALILGDNIFFGENLRSILSEATLRTEGASIFAYKVSNPRDYGVIEFDKNFKALSIEEKPCQPRSSYAIPGIYFYDNDVVDIASSLLPSKRGEYEISDVNKKYLNNNSLRVNVMGRGTAWLDAGTPGSLIEASQFFQVIDKRQSIKVSCPEEVAWRMGLIDYSQLMLLANEYKGSTYGEYLSKLSD